jgi:hypothetical protein
MAYTYKILGQSAPADTSAAALYTVPASTEAIVSSITVANVTGSEATYRIFVRQNGATAAASNALAYDAKCAGNSTVVISAGLTLDASDVISVRSGTGSALTFMAFGSEIVA